MFKSKKRFSSAIIPVLLGFAISWNCSDNPVQPDAGVNPELSNITVPSVLFNGSSTPQVISVRVSDPQGRGDIRAVTFVLLDQDGSVASGTLSDDGTNGDLLPRDNVYSVLLQGTVAQSDTGLFTLRISAEDKSGNQAKPAEVTLRVRAGGEVPVSMIAQVNLPSSLPVDSLFTWVVEVRLDGTGGNIGMVTMEFFPPSSPTPTLEKTLQDDGSDVDRAAGDGIYSTSIESALFTEFNDYFFRFVVRDVNGDAGRPFVVIVRGRKQFGMAPEFTDVAAPRMVNGTQVNEVLVAATLMDPEGPADLDTVQFRILLADNSEVPNSRQRMLDDGTGGDVIAGDGTFSALLQVPSSGDTVLDYTLSFQARDKAGLQAPPVSRRMIVGFDDSPFISNLIAPRQVVLNPDQSTLIQITLDVRDPQGLGDIVLVQFRSFLPNGQEAGNSPIELFDTGNAQVGDEAAGDGIYSRIVFLPPTGVMLGDFRWLFEARDSSGAVSNIIEHILTVVDQ